MDNNIKRHKIKLPQIILLVILIVGTIYVARENNKGRSVENTKVWSPNKVQKNSGNIFGTIYHITYEHSANLSDSIEARLKEVDNSLSPFNPESNITAINNNTTDEPDAKMLYVFNLAKDISGKTDGAFDITVAPLVNLWGFGFDNESEVDAGKVDSIREFVGIDKINYSDGKLIKSDERVMLDCSAIAKGFGVDEIGKFFHSGICR